MNKICIKNIFTDLKILRKDILVLIVCVLRITADYIIIQYCFVPILCCENILVFFFQPNLLLDEHS